MADNDTPRGNKPDHESTSNPDNRIGLERMAADRENKDQISAHPPGEEKGKNLHPPKGATKRAKGKPRQRGVAFRHEDVKSTGHQWDGIEEYDNPLPRWWLYTLYATIIWAVAYTIAYPAWPMITRATQGVLGAPSPREEVAADIALFNERNAPYDGKLVSTPLTEISMDPQLATYVDSRGSAVFQTWCSGCHGAGAQGGKGYPNLLDDEWLWGGDIEAIHTTITHGIRNTQDPDARYSQMPQFGVDELLDEGQIADVVNFVLSLSGPAPEPERVARGEEIFLENCTACHGEDAKGDRDMGAPNLTDAVWLYGGDYETVYTSVHNARFGVMPAWHERLSEAEIRAVASYVHSLGGGE